MSGAYPCGCRDCFDVAIGEAGALCHECEAAGCVAAEWDEQRGDVARGVEFDCQRDDAYEGGESCSR